MRLADWFNVRMFNMVHGNNLVYNTCWEDPRLDRVALELGSDDNVMVIVVPQMRIHVASAWCISRVRW